MSRLQRLILVIATSLVPLISQALPAPVSISLVPSAQALEPDQNVLIDIRVSRAGAPATDPAIAAFSFDFVYDTALFSFVNAFVGDRLGDVTSGEAFTLPATLTTVGVRTVVSMFEISLLDELSLDALQKDATGSAFDPVEFTLGSIALKAGTPPNDPFYSYPVLVNTVLSDALGGSIGHMPTQPSTELRLHFAPEPPALALCLVAGLLAWLRQPRRISATRAGARRLRVAVLACLLPIAAPMAARADVTVLPLGDSLTLGLECPGGNCTNRGPGYRGHLSDFLGFEVIGFVGSVPQAVNARVTELAGLAGITPEAMAARLVHEGHVGHTLNQITRLRCGTTGICEATTPSGPRPWEKFAPTVTLLLAGTNDVSTSYWGDFSLAKDCPSAAGGSFGLLMAGDCLFARLNAVIEEQLSRKSVDVFVATLPPIRGTSATAVARNREIARYNTYIASLPGTLTFPRQNVHPVIVPWELSIHVGPDGTHLTDEGYKRLAERWYSTVMTTLAQPRLYGDLNRDGKIDVDDLAILTVGLNRRVVRGDDPRFDDPRDLDGDGVITVLDGRVLVSRCTKTACAR